jgi:hypothetical protein
VSLGGDIWVRAHPILPAATLDMVRKCWIFAEQLRSPAQSTNVPFSGFGLPLVGSKQPMTSHASKFHFLDAPNRLDFRGRQSVHAVGRPAGLNLGSHSPSR